MINTIKYYSKRVLKESQAMARAIHSIKRY